MNYLPAEAPSVALAGAGKLCPRLSSAYSGLPEGDANEEHASRAARRIAANTCCGVLENNILKGRSPGLAPTVRRDALRFPDEVTASQAVQRIINGKAAECTSCPAAVAMDRALAMSPGTVTFTVPIKLRQLVHRLVQADGGGGNALSNFARDLVIVVDEAHKEGPLFSIENERDFAALEGARPYPIPTILAPLMVAMNRVVLKQPTPIPGAPRMSVPGADPNAMEGVYELLAIPDWMLEALRSRPLPKPRRAAQDPVQALRASLWGLCKELEAIFEDAHRVFGQVDATFTARAEVLHAAGGLEPHERGPTVHSVSWNWLLKDLQNYLDGLADDEITPEQLEWDGLLQLLESAQEGHLVAEFRRDWESDLEAEDAPKRPPRLCMMVLDRHSLTGGLANEGDNEETPRMPPTVRWGPLARLVRHGACVILLSATPLDPRGVAIRLGVPGVHVLSYPAGLPQPRIRLALEPKVEAVKGRAAWPKGRGRRSEGRLRHGPNGTWLFTPQTAGQLGCLLDVLGCMHLVARNADEEDAANTWAATLPDAREKVRVHLFRGKASVGVQLEPWPIVMLGPPFRPELPLAERGLVLRPMAPHDLLADHSADLRLEDALQEICQFSCRTASVARPGKPGREGHVILLGAARVMGRVAPRAKAWGIDVQLGDIVEVDHGPGMHFEGRSRLQAQSIGLAPQGHSTNAAAVLEALLAGRLPAIFRETDVRAEFGWRPETCQRAIDELVGRAEIEAARDQPGKGVAYRLVHEK
ncbi:MAG: hypothetical protein ACYDBQ_05900 [Thermoplasmatota archaeon]